MLKVIDSLLKNLNHAYDNLCHETVQCVKCISEEKGNVQRYQILL